MTQIERKISFVEPLPGFAGENDYTLAAIDPDGVLYALRSTQHPELRFVLTPAQTFFPAYIPDAFATDGVLGSDDVELMLMLTIGTGLADATANLRAPIALSPTTGRAVQLVLDDESLPMWQPVLGLKA